MTDTRPIRVQLSDSEWADVRTLAIRKGVPTPKLVGDAIRKALLKGAAK